MTKEFFEKGKKIAKWADGHGSCPNCKMDFNGELIWEYFLKEYGDEAKADEVAEMYGATRTEGRWGKKVALYDMDRDRTTAWFCPQCKHEWSAR